MMADDFDAIDVDDNDADESLDSSERVGTTGGGLNAEPIVIRGAGNMTVYVGQ